MSLTHARSPMRSLSAVDSSMSENRITTLPLGASRARSGRSTSAQSARSSIDDRTAAPNPSLRRMLAVCHICLDRLAAARRAACSWCRRGGAPRRARARLRVQRTQQHDERDGLRRGDPGEHIEPQSALPSPLKYWMLNP